MGIHGIYKEIGAGLRIALSKVAVEHFAKTGRPLRIAIDTSIWLFQIQSSKGGTNPALRTFYYRLLRLISLSIHPLFVFDGPNKPPFKRNKRTGPNVASIPEFLAKQLLKQFGLPFHLAPGEAEAECALLQREGVVDAVLSEDVDTLMFGSGMTFRSWTPEAAKSKVPTHINLYDAKVTKETSGMDREGMILVALMSGGDYVPEGIPGCGPKTACEAARAGFGHDLCQISRRDADSLRTWKDRLAHELHTNESKLFNRKHGKLAIPDDFPNPDVLGYYTHPVISSRDKIARLERELRWDMDIDFKALRTFTGDAFDWTKLGGAKKFIRNLAPALLVRELRMQGEALARNVPNNARPASSDEEPHVKGIHGKRNHASTDHVTELRVTFTPHELVPIDLSIEEPDDEINNDSSDDERATIPETGAPGSPSKKRGPYAYDPTELEKLWVFETYMRAGAPLTVKAWEDRAKTARILVETSANREAKRAEREKANSSVGGMQKSALDRFARIAQPDAVSSSQATQSLQSARKLRTTKASQPSSSIKQFAKVTKAGASSEFPSKALQPSTSGTLGHRWLGNGRLEVFRKSEHDTPGATRIETIDLISSPAPDRSLESTDASQLVGVLSDVPDLLPSTVTKRRRSPLRRWATDTDALHITTGQHRSNTSSRDPIEPIPASPSSLPSPSQLLPAAKKARVPNARATSRKPSTPRKEGNKASIQPTEIPSSSPGRQASLYDYFSPSRRNANRRQPESMEESPVGPRMPVPDEEVDSVNLTGSPTPRRRFLSPECSQRFTAPESLSPEVMQREDLPSDKAHSLPDIEPAKPIFRLPASSLLAQSNKKARMSASSSLSSQDLTKKEKTVYRVRESLPGSFAVEAIDMTNDIGMANVKVRKKGKQFRTSEVSVLDLTGA